MLRRARRAWSRKELLCPRRRHPWELAVLRLRTRYRCVTAHLPRQKGDCLKKRVRERFAGADAFWNSLTPHPATAPLNGGIPVLPVVTRARVLPECGGHQHPKFSRPTRPRARASPAPPPPPPPPPTLPRRGVGEGGDGDGDAGTPGGQVGGRSGTDRTG